MFATVVIFIYLFDAFRKGRHIYTFENICKEDLLAYHPVQRNGIFSNVPIREWSAMVFSGFLAFPTDGVSEKVVVRQKQY